MLTPQEVSERAFQKASFGGYNMSQVDEFLDILTSDYTALYNENAVLKSKMKVLVDKVEEYRSTEEAMRKALMAAQRMADDLVKDAEAKKAQILQDAEAEAQQRSAQLAQAARDEAYRLQQAQQSTAAFVEKVRALHTQELKFLDGLADLTPQQQPQPAADPVEETASEIDDNVQRLLAQAMREATAENQKAQAAQDPEDLADTAEFSPVTQETAQAEQPQPEPTPEPAAATTRIDFGKLQFGRDYEIS